MSGYGYHWGPCPGGPAGDVGTFVVLGAVGYGAYRVARFLHDGGLALIDMVAGSIVGTIMLATITAGIIAYRRHVRNRRAVAAPIYTVTIRPGSPEVGARTVGAVLPPPAERRELPWLVTRRELPPATRREVGPARREVGPVRACRELPGPRLIAVPERKD